MGQPPVIQLVSFDKAKNIYVVNEKAIRFLNTLPMDLAVMAAAGPYRSGKSFLLNTLTQQPKGQGFGVGDTINSHTKGLYICTQLQQTDNHTHVLVMDTEGIQSTDADVHHDAIVFSLALLLSSYLVYNSKNTIDENALGNLSIVTKVAQNIQTSSTSTTDAQTGTESLNTTMSSDIGGFMPRFCWVLRDFALQLKNPEGQAITAPEYLEHCLQKSTSGSQHKQNEESRNQIRAVLKQMFPTRTCHTLVRPCNLERHLVDIEKAGKDNIRKEFSDQIDTLRKDIFGKIQPKMVNHKPINGPLLALLCQSYVAAINEKGVPVIQDTFSLVEDARSSKAVEQTQAHWFKHARKICSNKPEHMGLLQSKLSELLMGCLAMFGQQMYLSQTEQKWLQPYIMSRLHTHFSAISSMNFMSSDLRQVEHVPIPETVLPLLEGPSHLKRSVEKLYSIFQGEVQEIYSSHILLLEQASLVVIQQLSINLQVSLRSLLYVSSQTRALKACTRNTSTHGLSDTSGAPKEAPPPRSVSHEIAALRALTIQAQAGFLDSLGSHAEVLESWTKVLGDKPWDWCEEIVSVYENTPTSKQKENKLLLQIDQLEEESIKCKEKHNEQMQLLNIEIEKLNQETRENTQLHDQQKHDQNLALEQTLQEEKLKYTLLQDEHNSELETLESSKHQTAQGRKDVECKLSQAEQRIQDIATENERLLLRTEEAHRLQLDVEDMQTKVQQLEQQKQQQKHLYDKKIESLQHQQTDTESALIQAQTEICNQIENKLLDSNQKYIESEKKCAEFEHEIKRTQDNNSKSLQRLEQLKQEHGSCHSRINELKQQSRDALKEQETIYREKNTVWKERVKETETDLKQRNGEKQVRINNMQKQLQGADTERKKLQDELAQKDARTETRQIELRDLWKELHQAKDKCSRAVAEVKWHQDTKNRQENTITELTKCNTVIETKLMDAEKMNGMLSAKNKLLSRPNMLPMTQHEAPSRLVSVLKPASVIPTRVSLLRNTDTIQNNQSKRQRIRERYHLQP
jgi:hypothetical protein